LDREAARSRLRTRGVRGRIEGSLLCSGATGSNSLMLTLPWENFKAWEARDTGSIRSFYSGETAHM